MDLIILCVRALYGGGGLYGFAPNGTASLTGGYTTFGSGASTLIKDGVSIKAFNFGSGTFQDDIYDLHGQLPVVLHEIGHYFFGSAFANNTHLQGIFHFGLMDTQGGGSVMCGLEREILGWVTPTIANSNLSNEVIADAISTGDIYKIQKPNSNYYFYIENRQGLSYYENNWVFYPTGPLVVPGKGLLISEVIGIYSHYLDIECADGSWNWQKNGNLYVSPFLHSTVNRSTGEDELDLYEKQTTNGQQNHPNYLGEIKDFFNVDYNQVFSPWSNPFSTTGSNIAVSVLQNLNGIIYANIYVLDALSLSPSKPQNLKSSVTPDYHPKLTWDKNLEPDMTQYKVYRSYSPTTNFTQIGTATHNPFLQTITYIDYTIDVPQNPHQGGSPVYYRVTAVDNQSLESVKSDYVQAISDELIDWKSSGNSNTNETPSVFSLTQNYPNPFNPSTTIRFSIPEKSFVTLKIYDMLGREVVELVNEELETGSFEKTFDANRLASGVYIYRITAMKDGKILFNESKQMLLIK